eukprot:2482939-Pyramimonas_sp.AAC.1
MENGIDVSDAIRTLKRLRRSNRLPEANALLTAMVVGTWTPARKADPFGEEHAGNGSCACGKRADDFHRIWEDCSARPDHPDFEMSQTLLVMAEAGQHTYPCM